jgi:hypothetical protein
VREALERAWIRVGHLCPEAPEQFVKQLRQDFHARSWELYLMAVLTDAGMELERAPSQAPDILVRLPHGKTCWIEAVAPTPGKGPDAVFQRPPRKTGDPHRVFHGPQESNLILRYRSVLEDKLSKLTKYKAADVVAPDDAYVIAVYQGRIIDADLNDHDTPALVRAVLPIGETVFVAPLYGKGKPRVETQMRHQVTKVAGSDVSTTFFLDERTEYVSGVLFARHYVGNLSWSASTSLGFIHRRSAKAPLPLGTIPALCEMWVDDAGSVRHRGSCAMAGAYAADEVSSNAAGVVRGRDA